MSQGCFVAFTAHPPAAGRKARPSSQRIVQQNVEWRPKLAVMLHVVGLPGLRKSSDLAETCKSLSKSRSQSDKSATTLSCDSKAEKFFFRRGARELSPAGRCALPQQQTTMSSNRVFVQPSCDTASAVLFWLSSVIHELSCALMSTEAFPSHDDSDSCDEVPDS